MEQPINTLAHTPANLILYGPPGTGKTYHAKNYALAAVRGLKPEALKEVSREEINQAYQEMVDEGRIQFVTFHQSFSYEDFIEGIKPELVERTEPGLSPRNAPLRYVLEDGLFKRMCLRATYAVYQAERASARLRRETAVKPHKLDFDELYVEFLAAQMNLLKRQVEVSYPSKNNRDVRLLSVNAKGNLLLATGPLGQSYVVSRPKLRKLYQTFTHVEQITRVYTDIRRVVGGGNTTLYWAVFNELKEFEKSLEIAAGPESDENGEKTVQEKNYLEYEAMREAAQSLDWSKVKPESLAQAERFALVIDEINRGNVSQIFGELITLIEADKRGGQSEALTVQLPYSKTAFTVPPNLYLIGTMNTADRNAEALDTALRRRFVFVEMAPDYALLREKFDSGKVPDIARLLQTMNRRIARLLGKEYAIGHAYFMGLQEPFDIGELKRIFQSRLIPLLQEYFFGHEGKVELVIGEDFFEKPSGSSGKETPYYPEPDWAPSRYEVREDWAEYQHSTQKVEQMSDEAFLKAVVKIYQR